MTVGILAAIAMGVGIFQCSYDAAIEDRLLAKQEKADKKEQVERDVGAAKILKKDASRIEKSKDPCATGQLKKCMETLRKVGTK